jgi:phosphoribosylformylglycinamidine synthase
MLKGMEGSVLGIWVAHGEGKAYLNKELLESVTDLAPVRYVDDDHVITEEYPFNPNGSPRGIAALCSKDGRHLAIMPHPERAILSWQWPYYGNLNTAKSEASPWIKMFQNAYQFCSK